MRRVSLLDCYADSKVLLLVFQTSFCSLVTRAAPLTSEAEQPRGATGCPTPADPPDALSYKLQTKDKRSSFPKKMKFGFPFSEATFLLRVRSDDPGSHDEWRITARTRTPFLRGVGGSVLARHRNDRLRSSQQK